MSAGPVFRRLTPQGHVIEQAISVQSVALVVKSRAKSAGRASQTALVYS